MTDRIDSRASQLPPLNRFLRVVLGDVFLGFLAIVAAAFTLIPWLFKISPQLDSFLEAGQWLIILLFAVEYGSAFAAASSKRKFILNPWRIIDAATILIPLATLLPGASELLRSSPVLRLTRLLRVISLGARASGVVVREEKAAATSTAPTPVEVRMLPGSNPGSPRSATWDEFVRWAKKPGAEWYSIGNVGRHNVPELAHATGIPQEFISDHLLGTNYPHIETNDRHVSLFAWVPEMSSSGHSSRVGVLFLAGDKGVLTFSHRPARIMEKTATNGANDLGSLPFPVRTLCQFLKGVLDANEALVGNFEQQLRDLEELPIRESRPHFFEHTFRLKKELSAAQADLWRLRGVARDLAEARVKIPGQNGLDLHPFRDLSETADYLFETVNHIREGVLSLIELHLNVVSFEMNRVMRVLAVVSVLGLIPAVIGGLFGMNLKDNPWPFTLPQVTFAVCTGMATCLYFFVVKGWLR